MSIRRDAGGDPTGRDLYTLSNPGQIRTGLNTFTAPNGAKLDANATYWVVVRSGLTGLLFKAVGSNAGIDSGAAAGWTILPRHEQRENGRWVLGRVDSGFSDRSDGGVMKIRVNGTERDDLVCDRMPRVRTAIVAKGTSEQAGVVRHQTPAFPVSTELSIALRASRGLVQMFPRWLALATVAT